MRWCAAVLLLASILGAYTHLPDLNPTTVALTLLLYILLLASTWGFRYALTASFVSAVCFNYFFLPPIGTFVIADSQNWIALMAFLATALIGSNLSNRIRTEADAANQRRRELELLYDFGQRLLSTESTHKLLNAIPHDIVSAFRSRAAALYLLDGDRVYFSEPVTSAESLDVLRQAVFSANTFCVARNGQLSSGIGSGLPKQLDASPELEWATLSLLVGVRPIGSIKVEGNLPSRETLEAMSSLIAIAITSATAVEKLARADAAQESERLRAALLDSVTHDLRTPLTSIKVSVTTLLSQHNLREVARMELLTVINEESDRLNHLITQATEMARLDAREIRLNLQEHDARELIDAALLAFSGSIEDRQVEIRLSDTMRKVGVDLELMTKVLIHLIENAVKYSPAGSAIFISGGAEGGNAWISVADRGVGIEGMELEMIFDKFYRGQSQRHRVQGTGMGLAISKAILEAHGGKIGVTSQAGSGSVFTIYLPLQPKADL
ncbi:ATP-binding protein [Granulicella sibirica]|uniref:histidine kinase n=1 Tax=Granulicella sibirica TaxID=2479048 RepID=A0A4Q0T735_9BACT|nr:ATP-binding protein [Granulicella sibirica]RXH57849.1 Osmosensitive K+ channel histidine kinase KdpD [Granulicella sibirica]